MADKFKTVSLDTMTIIDRHIGKPRTKKRDKFENELRIELLRQFKQISWN